MISAANIMYTRLRNYTNMVVNKHGTQTFEVVVVMLLLFDVLVPYNFWTSGLSKYTYMSKVLHKCSKTFSHTTHIHG